MLVNDVLWMKIRMYKDLKILETFHISSQAIKRASDMILFPKELLHTYLIKVNCNITDLKVLIVMDFGFT